jgi:hypothetical protein
VVGEEQKVVTGNEEEKVVAAEAFLVVVSLEVKQLVKHTGLEHVFCWELEEAGQLWGSP